MKTAIFGSLGILILVNVLPYACRLWHGLEWAGQYLPDGGQPWVGFLFFGAFATIPAIPLIAALFLRTWIPITFILSLITATAALSYFHHDYDLSADAQAALGLVVIPIFAAGIILGVFVIAGLIELLIRKLLASRSNADSTPQS